MSYRLLAIICFVSIITACHDSKRIPGSSSGSSSSSSSASSSSTGGPLVAACHAEQFEPPAAVTLQAVLPPGTFQQPTGVTFFPGDDNIYYVHQQDGKIFRAQVNENDTEVDLWLDLSDAFNIVVTPEGPDSCHECGLYSMEFHPQFADNGYLYFSFTVGGAVGGDPLESIVLRLRSDDAGESVTLDSNGLPIGDILYRVTQPTRIHNNGKARFGPDGYLYVGFGDGGNSRHAQNPGNPFGSILRLQDDGTPAPGNLVSDGLAEVYAIGLRNPWFWSFDQLTGELWAGDVGQADIEEVDIIVNGGNYGWPCFEGTRVFDFCENQDGMTKPVWDHTHKEGRSVTGGYVYRGEQIPELFGVYIFGDFVAGTLWGLVPQEDGTFQRLTLSDTGRNISAFAQDSTGEVYLVDYAGGLFKMLPMQRDPNRMPLPEKLSETGCMNPDNIEQAADALIPYSINEPFWSDNAVKSRYISLPDKGKLRIEATGDFQLPTGSILMKQFRLNDKLIETRLMLLQKESGWTGYSYRWNEDGTEALLLDQGVTIDIDNQQWRYPNRGECAQCHTRAAGHSLGLEAAQLDLDVTLANGAVINQLAHWAEQDLLFNAVPRGSLTPEMVDSRSTRHDLDERVASYLHANCSQCHRPEGNTQASLDFRLTAGLRGMNACLEEPNTGDLGFTGAKLLVPGDPDASILYQRLVDDGDYRMPPIGSTVHDLEGAELIREWILAIDECPSKIPEDQPRTTFSLGGKLLHQLGGQTLFGDATASQAGARWVLEPVENLPDHVFIRSDETPNDYLNFEEQRLEVSEVRPFWYSAHWRLEQVDGGYHIINRWMPDRLLQVDPQTNEVILAMPPDDPLNAVWQVQTLTQ